MDKYMKMGMQTGMFEWVSKQISMYSKIISRTYSWIKAFSELLESWESPTKFHIRMITIQEDTKNGLSGTGIVDDL